MRKSIPFMQIRGGSSKGLFFNAADLPSDTTEKDHILLAAMCGLGPDDPRQIDGLGGADPLTSKVAVVSISERDDADVDYEFVQVVPGGERTDRTQNCGNILAGVVPFALETRMIPAGDHETVARVFMVNSSSICTVRIPTPGGQVTYAGDARIDGAPGTAAPVSCNYADITGSTCGSLFPTGNLIDTIDGVEVTCIDNGMPVVLLRASDLGKSGYEMPSELESDADLKERLEGIRLRVGNVMNLGNVRDKTVPKMTLISPPRANGLVSTRSFIPHRVHAAIGVLAAVTVATGCLIPGTIADSVVRMPAEQDSHRYVIEHPSGDVSVSLNLDTSGDVPLVLEAGIIRTARALSRGEVFLPEGV